jgi:hypothetical protein
MPQRSLLSLLLSLALACIGAVGPAQAAVPNAQRSALIALYNATGGPTWKDRSGWLGPAGSECQWLGVTCNAAGTAVVEIFLSDNGLRNSLPASLSNISSLEVFEAEGNDLTGALPNALGTLGKLKALRLSLNRISSTLPKELGNLASLEVFSLAVNLLTGAIPAELGKLSKLRVLDLSRNSLSGPIPGAVGQLAALQFLDLSANQLTGALPPQLGQLQNLLSLFAAGNQLTGAVPVGLASLPKLTQLSLGDNQLSGPVPGALGNLLGLQLLDLRRNQLTGQIPAALGNAVSLSVLLLSGNRLVGVVPEELGNLFGVTTLWLDGNRLVGPVPLALAELSELRDEGGLDLRGNALATDIEVGLKAFLDGKQAGGDWASSQAVAAPFVPGSSLSGLADRRAGGLIHWTVETGAGSPPLAFSTDALGSGNADLLVRFGAPPTAEVFDASSTGPGNQESVSIAAPQAGTYYLSLLAKSPYEGVTLRTGALPGCFASATAQCLAGGRFRVEATWRLPGGQQGTAQAVPLSGDTGYFWFFNDANVEMVVKVLDACGVNGRFWVFAGGLTDVAVDIAVTDTVTGTVRTYRNPQGTAFQPIQDTGAFPTCGAANAEPAAFQAVEPEPHKETCAPGGTALCLGNGRFAVEVDWQTPGGQSGTGTPVSLSADTGYFWFFNDANVEMVIKVLDACGVNGRFWVFAGGLTDVETTIRVTDTATGAVETYTNPQGTAFRPIQDTGAFPTCP